MMMMMMMMMMVVVVVMLVVTWFPTSKPFLISAEAQSLEQLMQMCRLTCGLRYGKSTRTQQGRVVMPDGANLMHKRAYC